MTSKWILTLQTSFYSFSEFNSGSKNSDIYNSWLTMYQSFTDTPTSLEKMFLVFLFILKVKLSKAADFLFFSRSAEFQKCDLAVNVC